MTWENVRAKIIKGSLKGQEIEIEDYWEKVYGKSWMDSDYNPAAFKYGLRSGMEGLPMDDNVLYGKIGPFGHLVHESELERL